MEFNEKLQKIRKEHNITQEGLADKLNVSRQAVSKWESGGAYPDTEKLIQISKIFNVSLDELINDNKEPIENKKQEKFNLVESINNILEFIQKSFTMFWSMKFTEKIKCLFEMIFLILILMLASVITNSIITEIVRRLFMFLPFNLLNSITYLVSTIIYIAWIVLGTIIVIKTFKTRYLDYYIIITDENVKTITTEEPIKELKEKKDYKIVIRDPQNSNLTILKKIGKIFIFIFKLFCIFIAIPITILFIILVIFLTISLYYLLNGPFFSGISLAALGAIIFTYLLLHFIYNIIFNRENNYKTIFALFIISISLIGFGIGFSFQDLSNFEIKEEFEEIKTTQNIIMQDNIIIPEITHLNEDKIVIDNKIDNIQIDFLTHKNALVYIHSYNNYIDKEIYKVININIDYNNITEFKDILEGLKNKEIRKYDGYYEIDKVHISKNNLTKLKENYQKLVN